MIIRTFQRNELKYQLDRVQFQTLRRVLEPHMMPDEHGIDGAYMVYSLYFDTEADEIVRQSSASPVYKEKLRMRCYTLPKGPDDVVYLELKRKLDGVVSKRRATLRLGDADRFLASRKIPESLTGIDRQVLREIAAFLERRPALPKVFLSYERLALHDRDDPEFRITFDRNILARRDHPDFRAGDFGTELMDDDTCLMEIKICGAMPLWLSGELSRLGLFSSGYSKYGEEYRANIGYRAASIPDRLAFAGMASQTAKPSGTNSALPPTRRPQRPAPTGASV